MELFEYIKSQLPQMPNSAIMKQMGASEELIDYVKETPWNTNLNIINIFQNEDLIEETYTIVERYNNQDTIQATNKKIGDSFLPDYDMPEGGGWRWVNGTDYQNFNYEENIITQELVDRFAVNNILAYETYYW